MAAVMRIRCFVSALLVVAGAAGAQQPAKVYRIGYLSAGSATTTYTRRPRRCGRACAS